MDDILPILESGQMLGLIEVKSGDVSITERGYLLLAATPKQQKIILKEALMSLRPFQKLVDFIKQSKSGYITKQELLKYYSSADSDPDSSVDDSDDNNNYSYDLSNNFDWIIAWGRLALLIDYNSDNETITLRNGNGRNIGKHY